MRISKKIIISVICLFTLIIINNTDALASTKLTITGTDNITYIDSDNSGTISLGDKVTIGTESFYVISSDDTNTSMICEKLVDVSTYKQQDGASGVQWAADRVTSANEHAGNYAAKLTESYGINVSGSIIDKGTLNALGGNWKAQDLSGCPSWITNYVYWTTAKNYSFGTTYGYVNYRSLLYQDATNTCGLRPVITISSSLFYKITVDSNLANGSLDLSNSGNNITINPLPDTEYEVDTISAAGTNHDYELTQNGDGTYSFTFDKTYGDVVVTASFKKKQYEVNTQTVTGGKVEVSQEKQSAGETVTINPTASEGYDIGKITVLDSSDNEIEVTDNKFTMPSSDVTVNVEFVKKLCKITTEASKGGSISPKNPISIEYGENQELTITSENGYKISKVIVNNSDVTANVKGGKLILENVKSDTKVEVEFTAEMYEFTEGENATYSGADMKFKLNGIYSLFDKLYVNDIELDNNNYIIEEGSTVITLKNSYLSTLAAGTYKLKASYTNGASDETTFVIKEAENKESSQKAAGTGTTTENTTADTAVKTGDSSVPMIAAIICAASLVLIIGLRKKITDR